MPFPSVNFLFICANLSTKTFLTIYKIRVKDTKHFVIVCAGNIETKRAFKETELVTIMHNMYT